MKKRYRDGLAILDIKGDNVGDLSVAVQEELNQEGIIINFLEDFTDSQVLIVLSAMVVAYNLLVKRGKRLVLLNVPKNVGYNIIICKFDQIFEQYDDEDEAIESFKK